jgi:hypothetical protein
MPVPTGAAAGLSRTRVLRAVGGSRELVKLWKAPAHGSAALDMPPWTCRGKPQAVAPSWSAGCLIIAHDDRWTCAATTNRRPNDHKLAAQQPARPGGPCCPGEQGLRVSALPRLTAVASGRARPPVGGIPGLGPGGQRRSAGECS